MTDPFTVNPYNYIAVDEGEYSTTSSTGYSDAAWFTVDNGSYMRLNAYDITISPTQPLHIISDWDPPQNNLKEII